MLYYHKCNDCLTPFSTPERVVDLCDCGGDVTFMGEVHGDRVLKDHEKSACDGRCTHACGPVCDCLCGGANHGTGRMVTVKIDNGKVRVVGLTEEDIERAQVYRRFRDYAENLYKNKFAATLTDRANGTYIPRDQYMGPILARRELDKALSMRQYDPRLNALVSFIKKHKNEITS